MKVYASIKGISCAVFDSSVSDYLSENQEWGVVKGHHRSCHGKPVPLSSQYLSKIFALLRQPRGRSRSGLLSPTA